MSPDPRHATFAVADASALLGLFRIGLLHLLKDSYPGGVVVPEAVRDELVEMRLRRRRPEVPNLSDFPWLQVRPTRTTSTVPPRGSVEPGGKVPIQMAALDPGELAVIVEALCHVPRDQAVCILDERVAREEARWLDLNVIGVVGLLLRWKERGWLTQVRRYLDLLSAKGFFVDKQFRAEALRLAGETEADPEQA